VAEFVFAVAWGIALALIAGGSMSYVKARRGPAKAVSGYPTVRVHAASLAESSSVPVLVEQRVSGSAPVQASGHQGGGDEGPQFDVIELLEFEGSGDDGETQTCLIGSYDSEFRSVLKIEAVRQQYRSSNDHRPRRFIVADRRTGDTVRLIEDSPVSATEGKDAVDDEVAEPVGGWSI
jgi:hypothetical protein